MQTPTDKEARTDVQTDARKDSDKDLRKAATFDRHRDGHDNRSATVIVLSNHKGGVTKTTSTANLGAMLAEAGQRTLIVDCDPQANLSEAFGWTEEIPGERLEDLLARPEASTRFQPAAALRPDVGVNVEWRERLRIIPCTDALADVAADLPHLGGAGHELRLRQVIDAQRPSFHVVLLDTPPGLGTLSGLAMLAADQLLIPALAADLDVRGAGKLYDLVEAEVPGLRIIGVLIAASERRWRVTRDAAARMDADDMRVLPVHVPRAVRVASAPRYRAPTAVLEPDSMISHAYRQLAAHILEEIAR
jgi:chromosome partitioning protein